MSRNQVTVTTDSLLISASRVLEAGSANSTLKWALLLAMIDTAPLFAESKQISLRQIAESVKRTYSKQLHEFPATGRHLRQSAGGGHDLRLIGDLRNSSLRSEECRMTAEVAWTLAQWPAPRLQIIDGEVEPFLFAVPDDWLHHLDRRGSFRPVPRGLFPKTSDGFPYLEPLTGAPEALMRVGPLLRPAIEARWVDQVAKINRIHVDPETSLRGFLFPSNSRITVSPDFRRGLLELQGGRCFWCLKHLSANQTEVDHVVAWAASRNDLVENLVMTCKPCNRVKTDLLIHPDLARRWLQYINDHRQQLEELAGRFGGESDVNHSTGWLFGQYRVMLSMPNWNTVAVRSDSMARMRVSSDVARAFLDEVDGVR